MAAVIAPWPAIRKVQISGRNAGYEEEESARRSLTGTNVRVAYAIFFSKVSPDQQSQ